MSGPRSRWRAAATVAATCLVIAACASAVPTPSPTPRPTPTPAPTRTPIPTVAPTPTPRPSPIPIPLDEELLGSRFTVLVVGRDSSQARRATGREESRTDALMVISISADQSTISILSLPRDTVDVPLAGGGIYRGKVNGIADALGVEVLRGAMATLLAAPIDRYIAVDMDDFAWMVDAVGGIDIVVPRLIVDRKIYLRLEAGPAHLDGDTALRYARTRFDSDYGRAARQQEVMLALARAWLTPGLSALIGSTRFLGSLETDIRPADIPTLLEIGRRSVDAEVTAIVLQPPRFSLFVGIEPNSSRGYVQIPNLSAIRAYAAAVLAE